MTKKDPQLSIFVGITICFFIIVAIIGNIIIKALESSLIASLIFNGCTLAIFIITIVVGCVLCSNPED